MKKRKFISLSVVLSLLLALLNLPAYAEPKPPQILFDEKYKTPLFMSEQWSNSKIKNKHELVWTYLTSKKALLKIQNNVKSHFRIIKEEKDSLGFTHFRLQQVMKGVKVFGADQTIHINKKNQITSYFGLFIPGLEQKNIPTTPIINGQQAERIVINDLKKTDLKDLNLQKDRPKIKKDLWIYPHNNAYYLAHEVKVSTVSPKPSYWHYYIHAINGKIIHKYNAIQHAKGTGIGIKGDRKTFEVHCTQGNRDCYLDDRIRGKGIKTHDAKNKKPGDRSLPGELIYSPTTTFNEKAGVDAHTYLERSYDYFKNTHGRNSFDNNGAPIISSVHVGDKWNNAAWNGEQILFGDGDNVEFINLAASLDVAAHELTHAVTEKTANLIYFGEPGALNESISDIFAVMVDNEDWLIGEDIYLKGNGFRSLEDPAKHGQPDHYSKRYIGIEDNGGVHINSGINNKAAYLMISKISGEKNVKLKKAADIYYRALTYYLTRSSNFKQMRRAAIQAAKDLYGNDSNEVKAVTAAYDAVGVK